MLAMALACWRAKNRDAADWKKRADKEGALCWPGEGSVDRSQCDAAKGTVQ